MPPTFRKIMRREGALAAGRAAFCKCAFAFAVAVFALFPAAERARAGDTDLAARQSAAKYSPLDQITRENVDDLELAWEYRTGEDDASAAGQTLFAFEDEPILAAGNLVVCTQTRRLIALDPKTGEERWIFDPGVVVERMRKCRGISAWTDDAAPEGEPCKTRLLMGTADYRLIAIDAKTGLPCADFGVNGVVQMETTKPLLYPGEVAAGSRPAVVNGVVVIGSAVADNQRVDAPSGRVLAFDARTGEALWEFDPVPRDPADPAYETWGDNSAEVRGGGNVWSDMSVDEERDLVFLPTTSPSVDFFGGDRPGDNEYTSSVVALRGATGEVVWHFQFVHHNIWDYDTPTAPMLIDYPYEGEMVPALVQNTKMGLVFVFNRETGEPLVPIEERPAPQEGAVPEEAWLSPTQPFSVGMPALTPQSFSPDDAWGMTPFDKGSCRRKISSLLYGPIYTPPSAKGTIFMPSPGGGANWGGGAYDPEHHIMIVPTARVPAVIRLIPADEVTIDPEQAIEMTSAMLFPNEGAPYAVEITPLLSSFGAPCSAPPWAALTALDIVEKKILWDVPLGTIEKLAPVPLPIKLGTPGAGGPLATAGGVVFIGYSLDHRFRAFDILTGEELWKSKSLPAAATATPVTYEAGGEQYVVIAAGGHSMYGKVSDAVVAFKLKK